MAINKRHKRKITAGESVFYWTSKYFYPHNILRLTVMTDEKTHSRLVRKFKYKDFRLYFKEFVEGEIRREDFYENELMNITDGSLIPWLDRQIIQVGRREGWKPLTKEKDFVMEKITEKIDINLLTERAQKMRQKAFPHLKI
jgi:hypothetical protein